jgi:D-arabinose 1-dehydrogenase-like Zn-dependent alcohol dehydrogenase
MNMRATVMFGAGDVRIENVPDACIKPEIIKISMNGIDDAWKKVFDKQVRYRFVIDMGGR